jgi:nitroreductase
MELTALEKLIKSRRSVRKWQDKTLPAETILRAIDIAKWAPSGGNKQNWHLTVILKRQVVEEIADNVQGVIDRMALWEEAGKFAADITRAQQVLCFFRNAPALIIVSAARYQSTFDKLLEIREAHDPEARRIREYRNTADSRIQSVSAMITHLLLVLHQIGIGAVWMTGPMVAKPAIERIIGLPPHLDTVAGIALGYPAEQPAARERLSVNQICTVIE